MMGQYEQRDRLLLCRGASDSTGHSREACSDVVPVALIAFHPPRRFCLAEREGRAVGSGRRQLACQIKKGKNISITYRRNGEEEWIPKQFHPTFISV